MSRVVTNIFICIFLVFELVAVDIGSDTAVTRFNSQVVANDGDRIAGFAALYGGLAISDANATVTWDTFFPLSGPLSLTGGTLNLNRDLVFHDVLEVGFLGNIVGNGHTIELPAVDQIPTEGGSAYRCAPYFVSQISVGQDAETLSWNYTEDYLATFGDSGVVVVYQIINDTLVEIDTYNTGALGAGADGAGDVAWHPTKNILALTRQQNGAGNGSTWTFSFDGATISLIDNDFYASDGRACAWHPSGNFLAVGSLTAGAQVKVYPVDSSGNLGVPVTTAITPVRTVQYETVQFDTTGNYFTIGLLTDSTNPELLIYEITTAPLTIVGINASLTIGSSIGGLDWGKGPDYLAMGIMTGGATTDNVRVYSFNDGGGGVGAGSLTFQDAVNDLGRTVEGVSWESSGECFSVSTDEAAGLAFFNTYAFDAPSIILISNFSFSVAAGDDLEATRWGPIGSFAAVAGDDDIIRIYALPAGTCYTWSDVTLLEASDTLYTDLCLTFEGDNTWSGKGCIVDFSSTTTIYIAPNSGLMFRDMTLRGLRSDGIIPLDSTTTLSFNNVQIDLEGDYTFALGQLDIIDDVRITGNGHSFIFTSTVAGHITSNSSFIFDKGTTFRYAPLDNDRNKFVFDDTTSSLIFDSATLSMSSAGLQLTQGKIIFDGLSLIINEGNSNATSLELGDGVNSDNNVSVRWLPACNVELMQGYFLVNNV